MKKMIYAFGFAGVLVSCGAPAEEPTTENKDTTTTAAEPPVVEEPKIENSFLLEAGVLGIFKIGQPMPELPEELNSRRAIHTITDAQGVTNEHVQYVIFNSLEDVAEITMEHNPSIPEEELVIQEMRAITNYYETKDGIKIGTTVSAMMEKYPDTKIHYSGVTHDIVAEIPEFASVHFVINPSACTKTLKGNKDISLSAKNFNETAAVSQIKLY
jgi:hypothetical protein